MIKHLIYSFKRLKEEEILLLLKKSDSSFIPAPLSERVDLIAYSHKLSELADTVSCWYMGNLVGMCCYYMNDEENLNAFISILCVDPEFSGRGIGNSLALKVENKVRRNNYSSIRLEIDKKNIPSQSLFKKLDYVIENGNSNSFYLLKTLG